MGNSETIIAPQTGKQMMAAECDADVMFYGGAAFSGKTFLALMDSLSQVADKKYTGIIFRRLSTSITTPGGLWDTGETIYKAKNIRGKMVRSKLRCTFPSGAVIKFSHLENDKDIYSHHGGQYAYINFDELPEFTKKQFMYLMTRNRGRDGFNGRCYVRAQMNPDADSWVRDIIDWWIGPDGYPIEDRCGVVRWFTIDQGEWLWVDQNWTKKLPDGTIVKPKSFTFIGATISDNQEGRKANPQYESNLYAQDEVTKERLLHGNWNITHTSGMINPEWFKEIKASELPKGMRTCRYYDMAATKSDEKESGEPASTAGALCGSYNGDFYIIDVVDWMETPGTVETKMQEMAYLDGQDTVISWEEEKGSSGKYVSNHLHKDVFAGFECHPDPVSGDKVSRATVWAALAQHGHVFIVKGSWNQKFKAQCGSFPLKKRDQVDSVSGCYKILVTQKRVWGEYNSRNKAILNMDWKALSGSDVLVYVYMYADKGGGVHGNCFLWGRRSKKLFVYGEFSVTTPSIEAISKEIIQKTKIPLIKKQGVLSVHKVFASDDFFGTGDNLANQFMKYGIWAQKNYTYNEQVSYMIARQMFRAGQIIVGDNLIETDRQYKEWSMEIGNIPSKGYPLCRSLCGVVSDLREAGEFAIEREEPIAKYSRQKMQIREKIKSSQAGVVKDTISTSNDYLKC